MVLFLRLGAVGRYILVGEDLRAERQSSSSLSRTASTVLTSTSEEGNASITTVTRIGEQWGNKKEGDGEKNTSRPHFYLQTTMAADPGQIRLLYQTFLHGAVDKLGSGLSILGGAGNLRCRSKKLLCQTPLLAVRASCSGVRSGRHTVRIAAVRLENQTD